MNGEIGRSRGEEKRKRSKREWKGKAERKEKERGGVWGEVGEERRGIKEGEEKRG